MTRIEPGAGELEMILGDIERALEAQLWYVALTVALSLPDICSLLERPKEDAWSKRHKYAAWFDEHVGRKHYAAFTGDDCFSLRGGVIHHGHFGHKDARYDRVMFSLPDGRGNVFDQNMSSMSFGPLQGTALQLDLERFCQRIIAAVRSWYQASLDNPNVIANLPKLVRYRDEVPGFSKGIPLIA